MCDMSQLYVRHECDIIAHHLRLKISMPHEKLCGTYGVSPVNRKLVTFDPSHSLVVHIPITFRSELMVQMKLKGMNGVKTHHVENSGAVRVNRRIGMWNMTP